MSVTKDELAIATLRAYPGQIRLSNKAGLGYWWCYFDDIVVQANDPTEAILEAWAQHLRPKYVTTLQVANNGLLAWPEDWLDYHYNACNEHCDMLIGPCSCGAWHHADEVWVKQKLLDHNATIKGVK
ncbi:MAG: hypothetical protein WC315_00900 [Candidatus Omnitrophota bacterium]|jgi:hypothetical protein